jgi:hypothetical protein
MAEFEEAEEELELEVEEAEEAEWRLCPASLAIVDLSIVMW